jgi:hypothetical protein
LAYLNIYDKKISEYELWLKDYIELLENLEIIIFQKDNSDKIEEKIVSIGFSSLFMGSVSSVVGLFGIATGGLGGIALFATGWAISKTFNNKIFGKERSIESLTPSEKTLLIKKDILRKKVKSKYLRTKLRKEKIYFSFYTTLKREITSLYEDIKLNNSDNLSYKYKTKYSMLKKKYLININKFQQIYTHKKGN